jgi:hypothetical protein
MIETIVKIRLVYLICLKRHNNQLLILLEHSFFFIIIESKLFKYLTDILVDIVGFPSK